ncbi:MAG TPA: hypothetical protein VM779_06540 [Thermoanaerobaculia bacterium]|nr:hypothetical protein [Thermoanaerobaculia bacterium]
MSRRITIVALLAVALTSQPLFAEFHSVRRGLSRLGFEQTWIPFLGLARSLVRVVQPKGVHDFQIAIYENTPAVTGADIERMLERSVGRGFTPLVRVFSAKRGESVFIYARPGRGDRVIELMVLSHDRNETVLVRVAADAEIVARELGDPVKMGVLASR